MKIFKSILLILVTIFFTPQSIAQVYKFKSSSFSVMEKDDKEIWEDWKNFENSTILISFDTKKNRFVINSQDLQVYKIISYGEKISTQYDDTLPFGCLDNAGGECTILIVTRKNQGNRRQLYINYNDVKIVYNIDVIK